MLEFQRSTIDELFVPASIYYCSIIATSLWPLFAEHALELSDFGILV